MARAVGAVRAAVAVLAVVPLAACGAGRPGEAVSVSTSRPVTTATTSVPSSSPPVAPAPVSPRLPVVAVVGPQPTGRFPVNAPAVGPGANPQVSRVPDRVWQRMVGYSWTPRCPVGRSALRYVTVNFWGFDGKRSRGALVVSKRIASATADAFSDLYAQRFRIRQLRVMDASWGRQRVGPGADDVAAMAADNTSAFNCRYVGGQEATRRWSNHAYGLAIDVNPFENPYAAPDGTVSPVGYWLGRRGDHPGVFSSTRSAQVRAFTSRGLRWGGLWRNPDYQHFDVAP